MWKWTDKNHIDAILLDSDSLKNRAVTLMNRNGMKILMAGMEPTGHYWFSLVSYVKEHGMILVQVNPAAVKKSKELDDNNPVKSDRKDPKVIAGLVNNGRYSFPYLPEGISDEKLIPFLEQSVVFRCPSFKKDLPKNGK